MIHLLAVGVIALAASGPALAQTKVITGDKGFDRQELSGARLYDATGATVHVTQGRNNTCFNIRPNSPGSAVFLGGRCLGEGANRTLAWRDLYDLGNGASVRFEGSAGLTVRRHYSEFAWDPIKPASGSGNWRVENSWIKHARDDAIEADHGGAHSGIVRRTFFEGVHGFLSVTPGQGNPIGGRPRVEFHDNLMSLGCGLPGGRACENREKRLKFAWARPTGSGQAFKVRGCGDDVDILFRNNVVMMETGINSSGSNLPFFQCMRVQPGSTGNTFFWLGGCDFRGYEMTKLHGACVPARFKLDPAVWTHASNSRAAWDGHVARWKTEVWSGKEPDPGPDPEPEPAPEPDPEPAPEPAPDPAPEPEPDPEPDPVGGGLVSVDILPEQCPNRIKATADRNLPVVIAGTTTFDVRDLDVASIRLAGVAAKHDRNRYRDRAAPHEPFVDKKDDGDCTRASADGLEDLLLRFDNREVVKALGSVSKGSVVFVPLTGTLEDGTAVRGEDVVVIVN
jgi:hypothetical protein